MHMIIASLYQRQDRMVMTEASMVVAGVLVSVVTTPRFILYHSPK